jgi:putative flippase GtrA
LKNLQQFFLFVAVGGMAAAVNIGARVLFNLFVPFELAIVLAFPIALTVAFVMNRRFVFPAGSGGAGPQYARFALVNLVALIQVFVVSVGLARYVLPSLGIISEAETAGHVIGVLSPVATSYFFHRFYTFAADGVSPKRPAGKSPT